MFCKSCRKKLNGIKRGCRITAVKNVWRQIYQKWHICKTHNFCQILLVTLSYTFLCLFNVYVITWVSYLHFYRASSPLGGASENSSTENMNGDAKPTNSKVIFTYLFMNFIKKVFFRYLLRSCSYPNGTFLISAFILEQPKHFSDEYVWRGWQRWKMWWNQFWTGLRFFHTNIKTEDHSGAYWNIYQIIL